MRRSDRSDKVLGAPLEGFVTWGVEEQMSPRLFAISSEAVFIWPSLHHETTMLDPDSGLREKGWCQGYRRVVITQRCFENEK